MKRVGNLYAAITEPDNLRLAFWKAAKGKRDRKEVIDFGRDLAGNIQRLRVQLLREQPVIGNYRFFEVRDPKQRNICAAPFPERVLHHAIMNFCEPVLDSYAVFDSYACRRGKGGRNAVARAREFARGHAWYLQLDIHKYFDSIAHGVLLDQLRRRFKDQQLLRLFGKIFETYQTAPGRGLPIGNLVSQHLANFYLGALDHWLKETRRILPYLRYMDDFILFAENREILKKELRLLREWLAVNLNLRLKEGPKLNRTRLGFTFLGYRIFPGHILLAPRSKNRFARKFRSYQRRYLAGEWPLEELVRHMEPLVEFTRMARAGGFRKRVLDRYGTVEA
jgi:retron-type reverse transcriptase